MLKRRAVAVAELPEALAAGAQPEEPVRPVPVPEVVKEPAPWRPASSGISSADAQ